MPYKYDNACSFDVNINLIKALIQSDYSISDDDVNELLLMVDMLDITTINQYSTVILKGNSTFTIGNNNASNFDIKVLTPLNNKLVFKRDPRATAKTSTLNNISVLIIIAIITAIIVVFLLK